MIIVQYEIPATPGVHYLADVPENAQFLSASFHATRIKLAALEDPRGAVIVTNKATIHVIGKETELPDGMPFKFLGVVFVKGWNPHHVFWLREPFVPLRVW